MKFHFDFFLPIHVFFWACLKKKDKVKKITVSIRSWRMREFFSNERILKFYQKVGEFLVSHHKLNRALKKLFHQASIKQLFLDIRLLKIDSTLRKNVSYITKY